MKNSRDIRHSIRTSILFVCLLVVAACGHPEPGPSISFHPPLLIDTLGMEGGPIKVKGMASSMSFAEVIGSNQRVIDLRPTCIPWQLAPFPPDSLDKQSGTIDYTAYKAPEIDSACLARDGHGSLAIIVDTTRRIGSFPPMKFPFPYSSNPMVQGYPVFILNTSDSTIQLLTIDGKLMICQEALDTSGRWRPIEYLYGPECANGAMLKTLPPHHYLFTRIARYGGTRSTMLRVALRFGSVSDTITSAPFRGSISEGQFIQPDYSHIMPL